MPWKLRSQKDLGRRGPGFALKLAVAWQEANRAMQFEFKNALTDLDQKTPTFFLYEIFNNGSLEVRRDAIATLTELDPERRSARILSEILKIV